ncbi:MAG: hypothetical protein AB8F94_19800 [Saprospiraceae bacterium]
MIPSIALPFKQMKVSQQIRFAKKIVKKMNADIRFQALQPAILKLNIKIQEWQIAITNAQSGGKFKAIKKIEKGLTVRDLIFFIAAKVEIMAEENETLIVASGFENKREFALFENAFSTNQIEELLVAIV